VRQFTVKGTAYCTDVRNHNTCNVINVNGPHSHAQPVPLTLWPGLAC